MSTFIDTQVKKICIVNQTSLKITDTEIITGLKAIQTQLNNEFKKYWAVSAKLAYCPKGVKPPSGYWLVYLLDNSEQADVMGYHDATTEGLPQGKIFMQTVARTRASWTVTVSHEIMEMLIDPWGMATFFQDYGAKKRLIPLEVCDPVEADKYAYSINGIKVSNFVTPYWFHPFKEVAEYDGKVLYDYKGMLSESFEVLQGCHISYYQIQGYSQNDAWVSKNFRLGVPQEIEKPQKNGWSIMFKVPDIDFVKRFGVTKEELEEAIESAFFPSEGSRRDIRYKSKDEIKKNDKKVDKGLENKEGEIIVEF